MKLSGNLVGLVGWRGMVGSVLMDRMQTEGDFGLIEPVFFSTSNAGGKAPAMAKNETTLKDAHDIEALRTTPPRCSPSCAPPAGMATGSMPRPPCA
jgi:aspartate-semialdehyde dehydrogenase